MQPDWIGGFHRGRFEHTAPEDVILNKLRFLKLSVGQSQKHIRDIGGMLKISGDQIDRDYIETWAAKLEVLDEWQLILLSMDEA